MPASVIDVGLLVSSAGLCFGFFLNPIWPGGFNLAGQSLVLTASISSIILLGDSLGGMVLPSVAGKIIEIGGGQAMIWLVFAGLIFTSLGFLAILHLGRQQSKSPGVMRQGIGIVGVVNIV